MTPDELKARIAEIEQYLADLKAKLAEAEPEAPEAAPKGNASGPPDLLRHNARKGEWDYEAHPFVDERGVVWSETSDERMPWTPYWTRVPGATRQLDQVALEAIGELDLWDRNHHIYGEWIAFKQPEYDCSGQDLDARAVFSLIRATYDEHRYFDYKKEKAGSDYRRNAVRTESKPKKRRFSFFRKRRTG